jgi:hypothetical protein
MNGKKVDYLSFLRLLSFQTHGIASVARLQREEVSRAKKEHGGTGTFSTGIYWSHAASFVFRVANAMQVSSQITRNSASLPIHGKSNQIRKN